MLFISSICTISINIYDKKLIQVNWSLHITLAQLAVPKGSTGPHSNLILKQSLSR